MVSTITINHEEHEETATQAQDFGQTVSINARVYGLRELADSPLRVLRQAVNAEFEERQKPKTLKETAK